MMDSLLLFSRNPSYRYALGEFREIRSLQSHNPLPLFYLFSSTVESRKGLAVIVRIIGFFFLIDLVRSRYVRLVGELIFSVGARGTPIKSFLH